MEPYCEELQGVVERFLFKNDENGFSIVVLQLKSNTSVIVKGYLATLNPGEQVCLQGAWVTHANKPAHMGCGGR